MPDNVVGFQSRDAAANTTYNGPSLPSAVDAYYDRGLLQRFLNFLVYDQWGQNKPAPKNNGKIVKWRRYNSIAATTTPLVDGVTPTGKLVTVTDYECKVTRLGDFITITDECDVFSIDPIVTEFNDILGEQAGESIDIAYRDSLHGQVTSYFLANKVATVNLIDKAIQLGDIKGIRQALMRAKGRVFTDMVKAGSGVGTSPLPAAYVAVGHVDCLGDLEAIEGWIPIHKYSNPSSAFKYEVGTVGQIRFILTQNAPIVINAGASVGSTGLISTGGSTIDVYKWLFMGKDSYGKVEINGENLKSIRKPFGAGDDPLDQRATTGWKATFGCKILQDAHIIEYQCGCTKWGNQLTK